MRRREATADRCKVERRNQKLPDDTKWLFKGRVAGSRRALLVATQFDVPPDEFDTVFGALLEHT